MKRLSVAEDIVPVGEFRARSGKMLERVRASRRPLVITQNGRPAGVVISPEDFDDFREHLAYMRAIEEGIADVEAGRVHTSEEVRAHFRERAQRQKTK